MINKKRIMTCFGTRPEAIKMCPVAIELGSRSRFESTICVTAQHREMLDQVISLFGVSHDVDLSVMRPNQTLDELTAQIVVGMSRVLAECDSDILIVQGDTTTTFAAALAAFYQGIAVGHVEAGLRTYDKTAPFPEEMNRQLTSRLADLHFAPTERARDTLIAEGVEKERVFLVGNTVIDALLEGVRCARERDSELSAKFPFLVPESRMVLITGHRRESFGPGFERICNSIGALAKRYRDVAFVYPVHLNPNVQGPVGRLLFGLENVHLIEPQDYLSFVWLMDRSYLVLTDSGGIQEEAPSLGKPVLVMRETTERPEAVEAGVAELVGTDIERIVSAVTSLLEDESKYASMSRAQNPYGDGTSSCKIADVLENWFKVDPAGA